jgi:hypothetical protein
LKSPDKIFMWFFRNLMNTCSSSLEIYPSLVLAHSEQHHHTNHLLVLYMTSHQKHFTPSTADLIPWCKKKAYPWMLFSTLWKNM